jgi:hypothetical protein
VGADERERSDGTVHAEYAPTTRRAMSFNGMSSLVTDLSHDPNG